MKNLLIINFVSLFFLFHITGFAQTRIITGSVKESSTNEPLFGVNVAILGTTKSVYTDVNGEFSISAAVGDSIQFSYLGKKPVVVAVSTRNVMEITLYDAENVLGEVVITTFGRNLKKNVASSIESVKVSDLRVSSANLTNALSGRIAGLVSYQTTGEPGADNADFFVRGVSSFGYKAEPLILIDGFESSKDDLARLRVDDIEGFSVMKDAAATVMYGARSANGIISVSTKSGFEGPARVSARIDFNVAMPTQTIKFLDGVSYMRLYNEAQLTRNPNFSAFYDEQKIQSTMRGDNPMIYPNVDWYDALFNKSTTNQKADLSVSGGGQVARYYVSTGFDHETGLLKVDRRNNFNNNITINRASIRSNVVFNLSRNTTLDTRISGRFERYNGPYTSATDIFQQVMQSNPVDFPFVYEPDAAHKDVEHVLFGSTFVGGGLKVNPYATLVRGYEDRNETKITAQATLNQNLEMLLKGLSGSLKVSADTWGKYASTRTYSPFYYALEKYDQITGEYSLFEMNPGGGSPFLGNVNPVRDADAKYYYEAALRWKRTFDKHDVGATAVAIAQEKLITGGNSTSIYETLPEKNMGVSGRVEYSYDEKYLLEFIFGWNGSEKFQGVNQYGFFPAIAAAWHINKEKFFEPLTPVISALKLRASYGLSGNDAIAGRSGRFFFLSDLGYGDVYNGGFKWGNIYTNSYRGYRTNRYANPNITWETSTQSNLGLEISLFKKEALKFNLEYFHEIRSRIYMERQNFPASAGLEATISGNVGKMSKSGFDGSIDLDYSFSKDLRITGRGNISYYHNKLLELDEKNYPDEYLKRKGYSWDQQWGLIGERLFVDKYEILNSPKQDFGEYQAGDIKYKDVNGDGKVNENDRVAMGYPTKAEIQYGYGLSVYYKRWDISAFFQGDARVSMFLDISPGRVDGKGGIAPFIGQRSALPIIAKDYWSETNPNPHAFWPRLSTQMLENNMQQSSWWLRDASYMRLKQIEVGYNLPGWQKIRMQNLKIYLMAENLFTISSFKLWDPAMGDKGAKYPPNKRFNLGIKLDF